MLYMYQCKTPQRTDGWDKAIRTGLFHSHSHSPHITNQPSYPMWDKATAIFSSFHSHSPRLHNTIFMFNIKCVVQKCASIFNSQYNAQEMVSTKVSSQRYRKLSCICGYVTLKCSICQCTCIYIHVNTCAN